MATDYNQDQKTVREPSGRGAKPFRILLEQIEIARKFGSQEELESACDELLSVTSADRYVLELRKAFSGEFEWEADSEDPAYVLQVTEESKRRDLSGARLTVRCGHCKQEIKDRTVASHGAVHKEHVQFVLDNFPQEL